MQWLKYEKSHRVQDLKIKYQNLRKKYYDSLSVDDIGRIEYLKRKRALFGSLTREEQMNYLRNSLIERVMKDYEYPTKESIPASIMDRINTFIEKEKTTVVVLGEKRDTWIPDPLSKFEDYAKIIHRLFSEDNIQRDEYDILWDIGSFFHNIIHKASPQEILIEADALKTTPEELWEEVKNQIDDIRHINLEYLLDYQAKRTNESQI